MKSILNTVIFLGMGVFLNLFSADLIYAGAPVTSDEKDSYSREESPEDMDQSGYSGKDNSHLSDEWEKQGEKSLSAATDEK